MTPVNEDVLIAFVAANEPVPLEKVMGLADALPPDWWDPELDTTSDPRDWEWFVVVPIAGEWRQTTVADLFSRLRPPLPEMVERKLNRPLLNELVEVPDIEPAVRLTKRRWKRIQRQMDRAFELVAAGGPAQLSAEERERAMHRLGRGRCREAERIRTFRIRGPRIAELYERILEEAPAAIAEAHLVEDLVGEPHAVTVTTTLEVTALRSLLAMPAKKYLVQEAPVSEELFAT